MVGRGTSRSGRSAARTPTIVSESQDDLLAEPPPGGGISEEDSDPGDEEEPLQVDPNPDPTAELARVLQQLAEAQQVIAALQRSSATPAPVAQAREPKVNKPTPFGGKLSEYSTFISQCILTFTLCPITYEKDEQKVLYVISYLAETPRKWARPILEDEEHPLRKSFPAFKAALDDIYADRNLRQRAEDKLAYLKQTKSAAAYAAEFLEVTAPLDLGEDGLRTWFYKGLKTDLKKSLVFLPEAKTFHEFVSQCISLDQRLYHTRKEEELAAKASKSSSKPPDNSKKTHSSASSSNAGARSSDSSPPKRQQSDRPRGPLSEEEKQRRRDERLCFRCGKPDHVVRDCPLNKEDASLVHVPIPGYPAPSMPPENWASQVTMRSVS